MDFSCTASVVSATVNTAMPYGLSSSPVIQSFESVPVSPQYNDALGTSSPLAWSWPYLHRGYQDVVEYQGMMNRWDVPSPQRDEADVPSASRRFDRPFSKRPAIHLPLTFSSYLEQLAML